MHSIALLLALALFPSPQERKGQLRFPLACDRDLPAKNTLLVLEFPPLQTLEKEGARFFPFQFIKEGFLRASLQLSYPAFSNWGGFDRRNTELIQKLRGLNQGFSFSLLSFPRQREKNSDFDPQGILILAQAQDSSWAQTEGERLLKVFATKGKTKRLEQSLGGTPLMGTFLTRMFSEDWRRVGILGFSRRGRRIAVYTNSYHAWDEESGRTQLEHAFEDAEAALGAGLGTLGLKRGGARIQGIPVFVPEGRILGRMVAHPGPFFERLEKQESRSRAQVPRRLGLHSIKAVQDTLWIREGKSFEKIEVLEREGVPSIFDALAPLGPTQAKPSDLLPPKALGYFRFSLHLPWIKKTIERFQASKSLALSRAELGRTLNMIRAFLGMPILRKDPSDMADMRGSQELLVLFALPSPGSLWPEIFILSPKRNIPLSHEDRLLALAQPTLSRIRKDKNLSLKKRFHQAIKHLGKGANRISYLNLFQFALSLDPERSKSFPERLFPGGGKLSLASDNHFEILSFSPASLRNYLRGRRAPHQGWCPKNLLQKKGDLVQAGFDLSPLVRIYPIKLVLLAIHAMFSFGTPDPSFKIPDFKTIEKWLGPEQWNMRRMPSNKTKRGLLVIDHKGGSTMTPFNFAAWGIVESLLDALHFGLKPE